MSIKTHNIQSVLGGWQTSENYGMSGQFVNSIGIDPDMPEKDTGVKPSGFIRPTAMAKFSGTEITGVPLFMVSNPKNTNIYVSANDGKVHTVASNLTMGTALNSGNALTTATGNGMAYYDNKLLIATNTNITAYKPLNGSPSLDQTYWTVDLGLGALTNTTYPTINGVEMPNHFLHRHTDDKCYIADVNDDKGRLHYIKTIKTTVEGDTDDSSTFDALDFDYGFFPTAIETYNTNLAVALIEGVGETTHASLAFWDTTADSYSQITSIEFPDPLITALKNVNGTLYVFSGSSTGGCRISAFSGGYSLTELAYIPDVYPPLAGSVDHFLNRFIFGTNTTTPEASACVFAVGAKERDLNMGLHNILRGSGTGANPMVTCLKYPKQTSGSIVQPIIGWDDDTAKGLDKISTTYGNNNVWQSEMLRISRDFQINEVRFSVTPKIAANMAFTVKFVHDGGISTLGTINNTNNSGEYQIKLNPAETFYNKGRFLIEWTGSALVSIELPIQVELELLN